MKRMLASAVALVALGAAGAAMADVVVSGDANGTVTVGQSLAVSVHDDQSGFADCNSKSQSVAFGQFGVGPLGPSEGGTGWRPLSVSCSNGIWTFNGSLNLTVPVDVASGEWVSVAVQEIVPLQPGCGSFCDPNLTYNTTTINYNFNHTYPVVTASASTTATATTVTQSSTTASATTAIGATTTTPTTTTAATVTSPTPTTVTVASTTTTTVSVPTTITVATTPQTYVINVPSTLVISQTGPAIYITIRSGDARSLQTLCWRRISTTAQSCAATRGVWRVRLLKRPGKEVFVLKSGGAVVAHKTVTIRFKS